MGWPSGITSPICLAVTFLFENESLNFFFCFIHSSPMGLDSMNQLPRAWSPRVSGCNWAPGQIPLRCESKTKLSSKKYQSRRPDPGPTLRTQPTSSCFSWTASLFTGFLSRHWQLPHLQETEEVGESCLQQKLCEGQTPFPVPCSTHISTASVLLLRSPSCP